jgi:hypothetical protein
MRPASTSVRHDNGSSGMTTARKVRANRQNARASTGPKSATGKARSSANARRHRLAVPIWSDPVLTADVVALAKHIAGTHPSPQVMAHAQQVADAQIEVVRVRRWRLDLMQQRLSPLLLETSDACELRRDASYRISPHSFSCWIATNGAQYRVAIEPFNHSPRYAS